MIALLQRVTGAVVEVGGEPVASIGAGLLVFIGVEKDDAEANAEHLAERVVTYRMFPDADGKMNVNVRESGGAILAVPQFTLAADTRKGTRPSFTPAASPEAAARLFECFLAYLRVRCADVQCGRFGADMNVMFTNQGPVTFWLSV